MTDDWLTSEFTLRNGLVAVVAIDEHNFVACARTPHGRDIGRLEFREIEQEDRSCLLLRWCYLDFLGHQYLHQGLGTYMVRQMTEVSGMEITAVEHDGQTQDDGSHLTGDAPGFVSSLRGKGLVL